MQQDSRKKDFIWNMLGSLIYALSSMIMAFFSARMLGPEEGGIFGFGFSTFGQQMFIISYFGLRPFHITDVRHEFRFGDYRMLRRLTSSAAAVFSLVYLSLFFALREYSLYKAVCIFLLVAYKIMDGAGDLYESECQRDGKLYVGGQALFFRTLLSMTVFMLAAALTGSLLMAAASGVAAQLLGYIIFDIRGSVRHIRLSGRELEWNVSGLWKLYHSGLPLFFSAFLDFYVFSSAKYAIDWFLGDSQSGVFNILFMPTNFIYLVANFIIKPFMTELAEDLESGDRDAFSGTVRRLLLFILGLSLLCLIGTLLLGKPVLHVLELMLGEGYEGLFTGSFFTFFLIICGGAIYALNNLVYYILIILRRQRTVFFIYLFGALLAFFISRYMVGAYGMAGGAISYVILMLVMLAAFSASAFWALGGAFERKDGTKG